MLDPPSEWWHAFDLVVEIITVQALPDPPQHQAIVNVGRLVGPGGTLLAVEAVREEHEHAPELGPWPLSRADINAFATDGLIPVGIDLADRPEGTGGSSVACRIPCPSAAAETGPHDQQRPGG